LLADMSSKREGKTNPEDKAAWGENSLTDFPRERKKKDTFREKPEGKQKGEKAFAVLD